MSKIKYLLPLIFILLLTFTLIGDCADLFGTYDQRIKLTISNTNIDAELTWFPVTVFLTSTAGEEVFVEFDADADFDRVAFTTSDGSTQIYADCELFDDSAQKAIYHVSKTGWAISNSGTTDFYMYYDNTAGYNTTYIGKSGDTNVTNVWDGNFKAVYHMNDPEYDIVDECDLITDWLATDGTRSIDDDRYSGLKSLKFITDPAVGEGWVAYNPAGNWDWSSKTHMKIWMKGDTAEDGDLYIFDAGNNWERWGFTYPTSWVLMSFDLSSPDDDDGTGCGDWSDINTFRFDINAAEKTARYDEIRIYPSTDTMIDSTSNNNDGTKKSATEPVEATGKVGQGQDFDGTDDIVTASNILGSEANWTVSLLAKFAAVDSSLLAGLVSECPIPGTGTTTAGWALWEYNGKIYLSTTDGTNVTQIGTDNSLIASTEVYYHITLTKSGTTMAVYINGVSDLSDTFNIDDNTQTFRIGKANRFSDNKWNYDDMYMDGIVDEGRMSSATRAATWIKAEYNSLYDTLLTYGSEETSGITTNVMFMFSNF